MTVGEVLVLPAVTVRKMMQTVNGKISLAFAILCGILFFAFFVTVTAHYDKANKPDMGPNTRPYSFWRMPNATTYKGYELPFPQVVLCEHWGGSDWKTQPKDVWLTPPTCWKVNITTQSYTPLTGQVITQDMRSRACYGFNMNGMDMPSVDLGIWCNTTGLVRTYPHQMTGITSEGEGKAFFSWPNSTDWQGCKQCITGRNQYVFRSGTMTNIGLQSYLFQLENVTTGANNEFVVEYQSRGRSYYDDDVPSGGKTNLWIQLEVKDWWLYYVEEQRFVFWTYLGFLGGGLMVMVSLHAFITKLVCLIVLGDGGSSGSSSYTSA